MLTLLRLRNFRNYEELSITFQPGFNLVIGENGVGKTNLLEAVFLLLEGRSFRGADVREMIRHGEEGGRVEGEFSEGGKGWVILGSGGEMRRRKVEREKAIPFVPEDIFLVKGNPEWRRRFIDELIKSVKPAYGETLREYGQVLRQRNQALKVARRDAADREAVRSWDLLLVRRGMEVVRERRAALRVLEDKLDRLMREWNLGNVKIKYYSSLSVEDEPGNLEKLERMGETELRRGVTLIGPHRDEIIFLLNGRNLRREGSQGEQKMLSLGCRICQTGMVTDHTGKSTLLLFDDCFSELDKSNRLKVASTLRSWGQTLATAAEIPDGIEVDAVLSLGSRRDNAPVEEVQGDQG